MLERDIGFIKSHLASGFTPQARDAVLDAILPGSAATINADAACTPNRRHQPTEAAASRSR
ncbi:MAG: hypothetical protein ACJ786_05445 [Catenulispora sp.]